MKDKVNKEKAIDAIVIKIFNTIINLVGNRKKKI